MIADVVLGNNIDTNTWITDLKQSNVDNIFVIDYEYYEDPKYIKGVIYTSPTDASILLQEFDSINFYKSLYVLPGMGGQMSSLYKK